MHFLLLVLGKAFCSCACGSTSGQQSTMPPMRSPDLRIWWNATHEVENAQSKLQTALVLKENFAARLAGRTELLQSGQALWAAVGKAE